jgi:hypothetical protein
MPLWDTANPQLKNLVAYEPGKPIDEVARELGLDPSEIVKLASNENPLGPSPKAKVAMAAAMDHAHIYPDGGGYRLRHAIAEKFGMNMKNVILGNGSNEIIELIGHAFLRPGDEVVTAQPPPSRCQTPDSSTTSRPWPPLSPLVPRKYSSPIPTTPAALWSIKPHSTDSSKPFLNALL